MYYLLYYQNITLKMPTTNKYLGKRKKGRKKGKEGGGNIKLFINTYKKLKTSALLESQFDSTT